MKKVGSVVFKCNTGLGVLAKDFYDNGIVDYVYPVPHKVFESNEDWYVGDRVFDDTEAFLNAIDVLLCFEVPNPADSHNWSLIVECKKRGIETVLMPMYESTPIPIPEDALPDKWIFPSELDRDYYRYRNLGIDGEFVQVPVTANPRLRRKAKKFIHNSGSTEGRIIDRNGTDLLIEALPFIKSDDIEIVIRSRTTSYDIDDPRVTVVTADLPYEELFEEGDAFIFPEAYNGLSLPLQEAYAAGMLVIAGHRYPINTWLPREALVKPMKFVHYKYAYDMIPVSVYAPNDLATMIDYWSGKDIQALSARGIQWGKDNSWDVLRDKYNKILK